MTDEEPPSWFKNFFNLESQEPSSDSSNAFDAKRPKPSGFNPQPQKKSRPSGHSDSDDEFDNRYGHLFADNVCDPKEDQDHDIEDSSPDLSNDLNNNEVHSEGEESVDEDLIEVLNKVPNWSASSSIRKFIAKTIDRPLPEEMIKTLNEDYIPSPDLEEFFTPPKMPKRLYRAISRMKSKCALKTEQNLYSTQLELFVIAKPLVAALIDLKPLGTSVSQARELLSITLQGQYSISLKISKARRENVRFLFKESLADSLFNFAPNHISLFGGTDFASQVKKAVEESKVDFSWIKNKKKPFQQSTSQGFQGRGANKFFNRRQGRGSFNNAKGNASSNNTTKGPKKTNYPKKGQQKE